MPQFETFTKRRVHIAHEPTLTIQMAGGLSFNQAAYAMLGEPKAVELLFARKEQIVGVRSVDLGEPHAYPIKPPSEKRDSGFLLGGRTFTAYYEIDTTVARRWVGYMDGDVLCFDLKSPSREVTGPRLGTGVVKAVAPPRALHPQGTTKKKIVRRSTTT